jgi:hypothetical protein
LGERLEEASGCRFAGVGCDESGVRVGRGLPLYGGFRAALQAIRVNDIRALASAFLFGCS